jgi:hypothetical protein
MGDARIKRCCNGPRMENGSLKFSQRVSSQNIPLRLSDYCDTAMTCAWILPLTSADPKRAAIASVATSQFKCANDRRTSGPGLGDSADQFLKARIVAEAIPCGIQSEVSRRGPIGL